MLTQSFSPFRVSLNVLRSSLFILLSFLFLTFSSSFHAQTWHKIYDGTSEAVAINPLSHGRILFTNKSVSDTIFRSDDGGVTWVGHYFRKQLKGHYNEIWTHQIYCLEADTNIVFAVGDNLQRSTDGGITWKLLIDTASDDGETLHYQASTDMLYFGVNYGGLIYRSSDHGASWIKISAKANDTVRALCTVAVSPIRSTILAGSGRGSISRSTDEGRTWTQVLGFAPNADHAYVEVTQIIYSKENPNIAIASIFRSQPGLMITGDDGLSWSPLSPDISSVWALDFDQDPAIMKNGIPQHLWTGFWTKPAIRESTNGGDTWTEATLPNTSMVFILKHDIQSGLTLAVTDNGVFAETTPSSVATTSLAIPTLQITQTKGETLFQWPEAFHAKEIRITDMLGKTCRTISVAGRNSLALSHDGFSAGSYIAEVLSEKGKSLTAKIEVLR